MKLCDTFFSPARFWNLCHRELIQDWKKNLMRFIIMYSILLVALIWAMYLEADGETYFHDRFSRLAMVIWAWGIMVGGIINASYITEQLKTKTARLAALQLPATPFEKFFSRWFLFTMAFIGLYFIAFYLADFTRYLIGLVCYPKAEEMATLSFFKYFLKTGEEYGWTLFNSGSHLAVCMVIYFFVQSLYVLGATLWPKLALVKTTVALQLLATLFGLTGYMVASLVIPESFYIPRNHILDLSDADITTLFTVGLVFFTLFNWTLAYFRFKEMEIVNRW